MDAPFPAGMLEDIEKFFEKEPTRSRGLDLYEDVFNTNLMFPLQRKDELAKMMRLARSINPVTVMEIGADKGGGFYHWCKCLPTVQVAIACEIRGTPYDKLFKDNIEDCKFMFLAADSNEVGVIRAVSRFTHYLDCLFIDGDKLKFEEAFDAYLPLMNPNGLVFFHDIQDTPTGDAFKRVVARGYAHETIIDKSDVEWAIGRQHDGLPAQSSHEGWLRHWRGLSCGVGVIKLQGERRGKKRN